MTTQHELTGWPLAWELVKSCARIAWWFLLRALVLTLALLAAFVIGDVLFIVLETVTR